ncbi:aldehyde ferredoxin oxidoreductase N-terminal domain-containing protein [Chloroflexota bacterium]
MSELYGWIGKILRVDLTSGRSSTVDTENYVPKYVGGKGIADRIAWEEIPRGTGAFDPENKLIVMTGPLAGTPPAASGGRAIVCGVAAQSLPEQYAYSSIGGWFPTELKYAGFDGIIIQGKSSAPCYLWIHDGEVEIKDAGKLWGLGTFDTHQELKKIHGNDVHSICIGPAGENRSRIAVLITDTENVAGQGGFGGVAGSKNLKAVCVKGSKKVKVAHLDEILKVRADLASPPVKNPVREGALIASWAGISVPDQKWRMKTHCQGCPSGNCFWEYLDVPRVTRPGSHSGQIGCLGPVVVKWIGNTGGNVADGGPGHSPIWPLWEQSTAGGLEASELINQYGLNTFEVLAGMVPWLVMGSRMGVITEELFGGPINASDTEWWVKFLHMVAYREGFGDLLAEGVSRAINTLGKEKFGETIYTGTRLCALGDRPQDLQIDTPISIQAAWGYTDHHTGRGYTSFRPFPQWLLRALVWLIASRDPMQSTHIKGGFGPDKWLAEYEKVDPYLGEIGPAMSFFNTIRAQLKNSLLLCDHMFPKPDGPFPMQPGGNSNAEARIFSAVTGIDTSEEELDKTGLRLQCMDRVIQIRNHDRTRELEWNELVPFLKRPDGTTGAVIDEDKFAVMADNFYGLLGWDKTTGWPTRATLEELGLKDVADELASIEKLP